MPAIPWYKSPVYVGAVVTLVSTLLGLTPKLAAALGMTTPGAIQTNVDAVFQIIALGSGIFTVIKRQSSPIQPLTLTQASADAHPSNAQPPPVPIDLPPPVAPIPPKTTSLDSAIAALAGKGKP